MRRRLDALSRRLTRGGLVAAAVALAALVGVALLAGVFAAGWWSGSGGGYAPRGALARLQVEPRSILFGDVVTARAIVGVDPRRIDPATVRLRTDFRPFRVRSQTREIRRGAGRTSVVELRYRLQCITKACVALATAPKARPQPEEVALPPAELDSVARDGRKLRTVLAWPPFVVHSRLSADEAIIAEPQLEPVFAPPPVTWTISPDALGGLALAAACLLALGAAWLLAGAALGDRRRLRVLRVPGHLTPVERALALAEHAAARGEADEGRKALERLALELRRAGAGELAVSAGRLAWSERDPSPDSVGTLASAVRSNGAR